MNVRFIHCIWLGGPKTKLAQKCLASWRRFASDWTIREWGLANEAGSWKLTLDGEGVEDLRVPSYVETALAARKWAFAADWLRFVVLEREGGVYLDFDVELIRPFSVALTESGLAGCEWCAMEILKDGTLGFAPGAGLALERKSEIARRMLSVYEGESFDGDTTVGDLMSSTGICLRGVAPEVFCPFDHNHRSLRTDRTIGVHHYALSWITPRRKFARWLNWHGLNFVTELLLKGRQAARRFRLA